jgi:hypothetical protein
LWSAARHVGAVTQKRRPAPGLAWASGRPPKPSDRILLAFGDLLSSVADAAGVVPERSSVVKSFPACSPEKVAPYATVCQLVDANNHNGSSVVVMPGRPGGGLAAGRGTVDGNGRGVAIIPVGSVVLVGVPGGRRGAGSRPGGAGAGLARRPRVGPA